jgi:hypothetical protein
MNFKLKMGEFMKVQVPGSSIFTARVDVKGISSPLVLEVEYFW